MPDRAPIEDRAAGIDAEQIVVSADFALNAQ
jgi:hypothetical protein